MLLNPEQFVKRAAQPECWNDTFTPNTLERLQQYARTARIGEGVVSRVLAEPHNWQTDWIADNDTRAHSVEVATAVALATENLADSHAELRELIDRAGLTSETFAGVTAVMGLTHDIGKWQSKEVYDLIHNGQKLTDEQRKIVASHAPIGAASFVSAERTAHEQAGADQMVSRGIVATGIDLHHNAMGFSKTTEEFGRYLSDTFGYELPAGNDKRATLALADVALRVLQSTDIIAARTDPRRQYLKKREGLLTIGQAVDDLPRMIPMEARIDSRYTEHTAVSGAELAAAVHDAASQSLKAA